MAGTVGRWRALAEFTGTMLLYILVLVVSLKAMPAIPDGAARHAAALAPMLPCLLMVWVILRQFRRLDEYLRLKMMEDIVVAAAVTALVTFTYGFLETLGWPTLSMFAVWPVMGTAWALRSILRGLLEARELRRG
ncbi:hypothetical protein [Azospirillum picis]|uniref:Membrane protein n=1 Tax=Azospirillum picis TaxID=488438 RepID=A0ABU0MD68_9PROT|nr:hypothetical protein [Azospirillum picis]MBP2297783.1 putative membrane protein [Azospirillum picis]MDQ0531194.1 putative membrane protein [Azospirillum picis]